MKQVLTTREVVTILKPAIDACSILKLNKPSLDDLETVAQNSTVLDEIHDKYQAARNLILVQDAKRENGKPVKDESGTAYLMEDPVATEQKLNELIDREQEVTLGVLKRSLFNKVEGLTPHMVRGFMYMYEAKSKKKKN